jgi:hypothetical protein
MNQKEIARRDKWASAEPDNKAIEYRGNNSIKPINEQANASIRRTIARVDPSSP